MHLINFRPPRIALLLTILAAVVHGVSHFGEPIRLFLPRTGSMIVIAGFCLMMWSWLIFKKKHLAVCLPQKTSRLEKTGLYRFSRNPMYLGMILMLLGLALVVGTFPFYLSAIGYFAIINFVFCPYEENKLTLAFGREYERYKNEVRRWL